MRCVAANLAQSLSKLSSDCRGNQSLTNEMEEAHCIPGRLPRSISVGHTLRVSRQRRREEDAATKLSISLSKFDYGPFCWEENTCRIGVGGPTKPTKRPTLRSTYLPHRHM